MFSLFTLSASEAPATDLSSVVSTISSSFNGLVGNCIDLLGLVLPVGLSIFSMYVIIGFSKKIFKQIAGK